MSTSEAQSEAPLKPRWGVFAHRAFTVMLVAGAVSTVGDAMFDTASSWLMTSLNPDPFMVSAVQIAITLPMFLLTLPAGALSDLIDPRKLLIGVQIFVALVALAFAATIWLDWNSPNTLLVATFALGFGGALGAPAWQLIAPMLVPKEELDSAIAVNSATYNVSRAVGPALAGVAIAVYGIQFPLWFNGLSYFAVIAALFWWRHPPRETEMLPAERLINAVRTGVRYVRNNRDMDATLVRTVAFYLFGCSYWVLLPLIARAQMHNGPQTFGVMMGLIGVGSIAASFVLNGLKRQFGPDRLAELGTLGATLATLMFALSRGPLLASAACLLAGASSIIVMTTLFVSAQVALPEWVRGRGLAVFLTVYFGAMTLGAAIWGKLASVSGLSTALYVSAAGALLAVPLTRGWKLQTGAGLDLSPSLHWRLPSYLNRVSNNQGPVLVTVEYLIDIKDRDAFLELLQIIGEERKRDGAFAWNVFEDPAVEGRFIETSLVQSFLEFEHARSRVTNADRLVEEQARQFVKELPTITILIAAARARRPWRKLHLLHLPPTKSPPFD